MDPALFKFGTEMRFSKWILLVLDICFAQSTLKGHNKCDWNIRRINIFLKEVKGKNAGHKNENAFILEKLVIACLLVCLAVH